MIDHTVWTTILLVTGKGKGKIWRKTCLSALFKQSIPLCFKIKLALLKPSNTQLVIKGQKRLKKTTGFGLITWPSSGF
jgi:hypothetical protein